MTLHEPATFLTDCGLFLLGGGLAWRLLHRLTPQTAAARWWVAAMFSMAAAALLGGCYHGFAPNFSPDLAAGWWRLVLILVCCIGACMGVSLVKETVRPQYQRGFVGFVLAKFLLVVSLIMGRPEYQIAMVDYGVAMLAWAVVAIVSRRPWSGWMLAAVGLSMVAGWAQQSGLGFSKNFNHNDVYHVIQALALIGFYRAGRLLS